MASKVQVELNAQVQGFVDGMNQASESAKQYETDTRKVKDSLGNFRKEFAQAKKDVMNLASAYSKLDATAKASNFGKEMAAQLEAAKQKASEMLDMQGDLNQELKNMASDTRVFDTLSEGMGVFMNTTASALGVIAQFTGNEEDARKAVVAFTTAQSVLQTVTKVQNALQKQSNTMLAIAAVQNKAAAAAASLKAAAEGKGAVATKASTVAQAAFNAVAKANPYVLLATAILGVAAALGTYMYASKKATAEAKAAAEAAKTHKMYMEALNSELGNNIPTFIRLQTEWKSLRTEGERTQWIENNKAAFEKLGISIEGVNDAENVFVTNSSKVIQAMMTRAKAAAMRVVAEKKYQEYLEQTMKMEAVRGKKDLNPSDVKDLGLDVDSKFVKHESRGWFSELYSVDTDKFKNEQEKEIEKIMIDLYQKANDEEKKANNLFAESGTKLIQNTNKKLIKAETKAAKERAAEAAKNSVAYAETKVKLLTEQLSKVDVDNETVVKGIKAEIDKWQKELNRRKLMVGLDVREKDKAKTQAEILSEYEKQLKTAEAEAAAALILAQLHQKDANEITKLTEEWEKATKARKDYEATKKAVTEEKPTATGSASYSDVMQGKYEHTEDDLTKAMNTLKEEAKKIDASTEEGHEKLEKIKEKYTEIADEQEKVVKGNEEIASSSEKASRKARKLADKYDMIGDAVASIGDSFASLSELAEDDPALNVAGIVAEAVANMFAGMARASAQAWELGPWGWAAFSAAALAQTLAMVAQIKSAAAFAEGGIVGGSSYGGDRIYSRLNSGEMVLNQRQQKNLFNLLDQDVMPQKGGTNVTVTGVIRGTDIMLVQKNTNKVRRNAGTQITF